MIEFVHDQCQIHPLHPGMIALGLSETVNAIVSPQTNILADGRDEFPGLSPLDVLLDPGVEEEIVMRLFEGERICLKVFSQGFFHALVDSDFVTLSPLLFLDPEAISDISIFANELIDPEFQKVRNPQGSFDPHHK